MRVILIGPPGSGKGTQAQLLSSRLGMAHISTGDLLRAAKKAGTPLGLQAKAFMDQGKLVPDELVNQLIRETFLGEGRPTSFLMDGYPRTVAQAETFESLLAEAGLPLDAVVLIDLDDAEIIQRITGRLTCPNPHCGASYHVTNKPPKVAGVCDVCGSKLEQREDDKLEKIQTRLEAYRRQTAELLPHYRKLGLLRQVPGAGDIETIYQNIVKALKT